MDVLLIQRATEPFVRRLKRLHEAAYHLWRAIQDRREAVSQAIGRAIHEVCFSGLIAPSQALPGGKIIAIFPKKLKAPEMLSAASQKPLD